MSVGYYKVDLSYTGYNLDGTVAVYGSSAPVDFTVATEDAALKLWRALRHGFP